MQKEKTEHEKDTSLSFILNVFSQEVRPFACSGYLAHFRKLNRVDPNYAYKNPGSCYIHFR
jgi:hypothetical protein